MTSNGRFTTSTAEGRVITYSINEATTASKKALRLHLTSDLKSMTPITYLSICTYCLYGVCPFGSFWGQNSLQMALEVKSDVRFEISDLISL